MTSVWPFSIGFLLPPIVFFAARQGGWWTWAPVLAVYAGLPLADALSALNPVHHSAGDTAALSGRIGFRLVTWLWVPVEFALVVWTLTRVSTQPLTGVELTGLIFSIGTVTGGIGITYAHELVHRPGRFELALGDILLALVTYPHFAIEHVYGHHKHVATPADPVSARRGEGFWAFLPRAVFGGIRHAWHIEAVRADRDRRSRWSLENRMVRYALTSALLYAMILNVFGPTATLLFAAQGVVGVVMLEAINYVEHYGLVRLERRPGEYERVSAKHSWDSNHRVSNWLLINLARHSDHHLLASKRYQALESVEASPQLPWGYGTMLLVAMVPPLWRRVMDPRLPLANASGPAHTS